MIVFKRKFVLLGENWFDEGPDESSIDVVQYIQRSSPMDGVRYEEFYTILFDLTQDVDVLLAKMGKNNRYKIRRAAARDELTYEYCDTLTPDLVSEFCDFYNCFAVQKDISKVDAARMQGYANYGVLGLSRVKAEDEQTLVWHAYYRSPHRACLLRSASHFRDSDDSKFRSMIGRANRYHHWQDMLKFKMDGLSTYDFGGWYSGSEDKEKLRINKFKEEFGGEIVKNFNFRRGVTLKGKLYLHTREIGILRRLMIKVSL